MSETIRKLRGFLGETQEQFARRMNTATITIARWETSRPPRGKTLQMLERLAHSKSLQEYAEVFAKARRGEFPDVKRTVQEREPDFRNDQERRYTLALLRILRKPENYPKQLKQIEKILTVPLKDMDQILTNAQIGADVRGAILRMADGGKSEKDIADIFNLDIDIVRELVLLNRLGFYRAEDD